MNNLQLFNYQNQQLRTLITNDTSWFVGKDVCDIIKYENYRDAIKRHCRPKGVVIHDTLTSGGKQKMMFIDEGNLYRLIIKSNMPESKPFENWVCDEVLPSIRKTGGYQMSNAPMAKHPIELEWFQGQLCLKTQDLVVAGIWSKRTYIRLIKAGEMTRMRLSCPGKPALVLWETVPKRYKNKIIKTFGSLPSANYSEDKLISLLKDICRVPNSNLRLALLDKVTHLNT